MDATQARLEYGKIVAVELDGHEVLFRPFTPLEAARTGAQMLACPEEALDLGLAACERALLSSLDDFRALADRYPLAFTSNDGALGELIRNAQNTARDRVQRGAKLWKASDRNLGRMAENLLAFKAYTGGEYTSEQFAGAMTVAEWMSSTKGIFNLFLSLLKALSKRRGR